MLGLLLLGPKVVAPHQGHIFQQGNRTRKQTKPPPYSLLQGPADGSQVIPSHITLGTQRPSDSCPSTQIRSILLEDGHRFPLLTAFPRAGTWPLQRLGVGGRYRNRYLVAQNLVLVSRDMWWLGGVLSSLQR